MSDDPLHRYLDDFGRRLEQATEPSSPRRPSRRAALAAAVLTAAIAAIVVLLVVVPGGGSRFDVVDKARAALADRGRLVHLIVRGRMLAPAPPMAFRTEQWSTGHPPRWRIAFTSHGDTLQLAFGHRTFSTYYERPNRLEIDHGPSTKFADRIPLPGRVLFGSAARDPIATIRGMLQRDELHDGGEASVGGQTVRRLVGERRIYKKLPRKLAEVHYFVDPDTYAPVAARIALPPPRHTRADPLYIHIRFESFERLPLTGHNERLLDIQLAGNPAVTGGPGFGVAVGTPTRRPPQVRSDETPSK